MTGTVTRRSAPARLSKLTVAMLGFGALGVLAWYTGLYRLTGIALAGGIVLGAAGAVGSRDTTPWIALSSVLFVVSVLLSTGAAVLAALVPADPFHVTVYPSHAWPFAYLFGVSTAGAGTTLALRQDLAGAAGRSLSVTAGAVSALTGGALMAGLAAVSLFLGPASAASTRAERLLFPSTGVDAFPSLVLLVGLTCIAAWVLVGRLPIPALVTRERRSEVRDRVERLQRGLLYAGAALAGVGAVATFVVPSVWATVVRSMPGAVSLAVGAIATAGALRIALLGAIGVSTGLVCLVSVLRRLRTESVRWLLRLGAHGTGGALAVGVLLFGGPSGTIGVLYAIYGRYDAETETEVLESLVAEFGALPMAVGILTVACLAVTLLVLLACLLGYLAVLPTRTAGVVLAAGGLVGASVVAGELVGRSVLLFGVVGAAIVLWDVGTYGQRLRLELRRGNRRLEFLHVGTALLVAGCSVASVYGAVLVTETLDPGGTAAAAVAALVGVLLVTSAAPG
jgi:hypothetical protein